MIELKQLLDETQERNKDNRIRRTCFINRENYIICKHIAKFFNYSANVLIECFSVKDLECKCRSTGGNSLEYKTSLSINMESIEFYKNKFNAITIKDSINSIMIYIINYMRQFHKEIYNKIRKDAKEEIDNPKPKRSFCSSKDEYINFKYNEKELELFKNTILAEDDEIKISKIKEFCEGKKNYYIVKEIYMMWKNNYTPEEIANVYGKNIRTFQVFFKETGLNRDRYEAQAIASTKRDYKEIMAKGRETMLKNNTAIFGSKQEVYLRTLLNCKLPIELSNSEVIVGLNNKSILNDGKEIDIPIIIIENGQIYKFAVEYNGDFWYEEDKDNYKSNLAYKKGYKLFYIQPKNNATNKQIKEQIEYDIDNIIIPAIKDEIN